jgi:CRP/FNR family transcriptional regulator, cyclic AMP receptor protein
MKRNARNNMRPKTFLSILDGGKTIAEFSQNKALFSQGDRCDAIYYIDRGKVKLTVISEQGKEAVVAILGVGDFFGEGCLAGQPLRMATAVTMEDSRIIRVEKATMVKALHERPEFSQKFMAFLLNRNVRVEEDLVDQLFNSSEKRLARLLLILSNVGKEADPEPVLAKINQETLAEMIGTTRSRVSFFMNKFRKLGLISYNGNLEVHRSLLNVVLHERPPHIKADESGQ